MTQGVDYYNTMFAVHLKTRKMLKLYLDDLLWRLVRLKLFH